jgi:hypothetical protein
MDLGDREAYHQEPTNMKIHSKGGVASICLAPRLFAGIVKSSLNRQIGDAETTHERAHDVEREKRRFPDEK